MPTQNHRRITRLAALIALLPSIASAHPGSGLAVSSDGDIYLSDVMSTTIWKIDPAGDVRPLLRDRWTHELHLAPDGTLYYEREHTAEGAAPCSLNRLTPEGIDEQLIPPPDDRADFAGAPFLVDHPAQTVYFGHSIRGDDGNWRMEIRRRTFDGEPGHFAGSTDGPLYRDGPRSEATFRLITDMDFGPDGSIYVLDRDRIRRIDRNGNVSTIGPTLIDEHPKNPPERRGPATTINRMYGMDVTPDGMVFVAYKSGRRVARIDPHGQVTIVHSSDREWSPLGVASVEDLLYVSEINDEADHLRVIQVKGDLQTTLATIRRQ